MSVQFISVVQLRRSVTLHYITLHTFNVAWVKTARTTGKSASHDKSTDG